MKTRSNVETIGAKGLPFSSGVHGSANLLAFSLTLKTFNALSFHQYFFLLNSKPANLPGCFVKFQFNKPYQRKKNTSQRDCVTKRSASFVDAAVES